MTKTQSTMNCWTLHLEAFLEQSQVYMNTQTSNLRNSQLQLCYTMCWVSLETTNVKILWEEPHCQATSMKRNLMICYAKSLFLWADRMQLKLFSIIFTFLSTVKVIGVSSFHPFVLFHCWLWILGCYRKLGRSGTLFFPFGSHCATQPALFLPPSSHPLLTWDFRKPVGCV